MEVEPEGPTSRTFPCEACGGELEFHIGAQTLRCPFCGEVKDLDQDPETAVREQDYAAMLERLREMRAREDDDAAAAGADDLKEIRCDACGANVQFQGTLTARHCSYCGVPLQLEKVHEATDRVPVDGVLPFLVDKKTAAANLRKWVKSRWFAPGDFLKRGADGRFDGVFIPYWTFDSATRTAYTGQRGDHYYVTQGSGKNKRRVRRTRWRSVSGRFQRFFDDVLVIAGKGLPRGRIESLEPWPLDKLVPFSPGLLAGFLARTYDVELEQGFTMGRDAMEAALQRDVRRRIGGDVQRITSMDTSYNAITFKHLLLPIWMLAYRYKGKSFQVVVNAGTGEVQGDRPWSVGKIALAVLAGLVVIGGFVLIQSLR
ncbi:hypothetical protein ABI59_12650 [Acidobacteria bacterium Mor1]|nr:hypothetical protein ABI59_12650 [Acidobacteria bacterium Mor1]